MSFSSRFGGQRFRSRSAPASRHPLSPRQKRRRILITATAIVSFFLFALIGSSLLGVIVFAYYAKSLPSPDRLAPTNWELSTKIFDRNGDLLYDVYGEQDRTLIRLDELPPYIIQSALAAEDAEFYRHQGFDIFGILRSAFRLATSGRIQGGGSTITQQLMKNALIGTERTYTRKIKELLLSLQVEKRYTKNEILQMYFNNVPYGGQAWGVAAAAKMYFDKEVSDLNLAEATLLAGLPQRPTAYSPFGANPEAARERQQYVLKLMSERGWLNASGEREYLAKEAMEEALAFELEYASPGANIRAPHFVMYIKELLTDRYGEAMVEKGGLQVTTTLDLEKQEKAEEILRTEVDQLKWKNVGNAALLAMDPRTGEILAMIGSKDYFDVDNDGNVNVTLRERQPGSSIKPITYATALRKGYTASTMVMDVETEFPGGAGQPLYIPRNYDETFHGPQSFRSALSNSYNLPAVKVLGVVGLQAMLDTAHEMGITTLNDPSRYGLSLTLGGGEVKLIDMATAFSVFANSGLRHDPTAILKVTDAKGKTLEEFRPTEGRRALSEEVAYIMANILSDTEARKPAFGAQNWLQIGGLTVAAKTGTTNDYRDAWTVGFTPSLTIGVWAGNNDNSEMKNAPGSITAGPIWNKAMRMWLEGTPAESFSKPEGITEMQVCSISGAPAHEGASSRWEIFVKGTEPTGSCPVHRTFEICEVDGKLASDACRDAGEVVEKQFLVFTALKPEWQGFVDKWVAAQEDATYHPPTEVSTTYFDRFGVPIEATEPAIRFKDLESGDEVGLQFDVEVDVITPYTVTKVDFLLDGVQIGDALTSIPYKKSFNLGDSMVGAHEIGVRAVDSGGNEGSASVRVTVRK